MQLFIRRIVSPLALLCGVTLASAQGTGSSADPYRIASISTPAKTIGAAQSVSITVTFTGNVTAHLSPKLHLTVGGVPKTADVSYYGPFNTPTLTFRYATEPGVDGPVALQSPLDFSNGSITGDNGVLVDANFTPPDTSATIVDTTPTTKPVITSYDATSSTPSFHGTAAPGVTVSISGYNTYPVVPKTTAAADGTWTITWPSDPLPPGYYTYSAYATNSAGTTADSDSVAVEVPPNGVPVVQQHADMELTWHFSHFDYPDTLHLTATNAPKKFEVTNLPPGVEFYYTPSGRTEMYGHCEFDWTYERITGGKYAVSVTATNSVGTSAPMTFNWIIHPGMRDFIHANAHDFTTGDTITFTTRFSAPVVVSGTPYIPLWGTKKAMYVSGSGSDTLLFKYEVTPDDPSQTGLYYSIISAGGGSITTVDGVSADLQDSYWGLGDYPTFNVSTSASAPAAGVPVVTNATIAGQVGAALTPVQLQATNSPSSFTADAALANYGLTLSPSGVVSGTPTRTADAVNVSVTATNSTGASQPATITLNIAAAPVQNPPPDNNPPPPTTKSDQTITFSSPTGAVIVGQAIQLGALSSAGLPITYSVVSGDATISGSTLTPNSTATLIVRAASAGSETVNAASVDVNFGSPQPAGQAIKLSTTGGPVPAEKPITLSATADSGLPVTYTVVTGPATISGNTLTFTGTGNVTVRAAQAGDATHAAASDVTLTFTANPVNRLVNLSSRVHVTAGDASHGAIAGFVVAGDKPKQILVRAVGPSLAAFGITSGIPAPQLALYDLKSNVIATNSGWNNDAQIAAAGSGAGAFALGANSKDAAVLVTLQPGLYTAQVASDHDGMVLFEVYDVSANAPVPTKQLINISTRGMVGTDDNVLVAGFVVSGNDAKRVLIRGVGPGLGVFGVPGVLADPVLKLYDAHNVVLARNDNWETTTSGDVLTLTTSAADVTAADTVSGAFALAPGSKDAALVVTLPPGQYTAIVSGANNTTGAAIVEVYELP